MTVFSGASFAGRMMLGTGAAWGIGAASTRAHGGGAEVARRRGWRRDRPY